jgi:putative hydrolase of the HAD superfamily
MLPHGHRSVLASVARVPALPEVAVDVVLFDLGGVLFDFGGVGRMKELSGIEDDDEIWRRWLECRWVRDFERGGCSAEDFAAGVVADWELPITADGFLVAFRSWLGGPLEGAEALVHETREHVKVGCLSNTNSLHWADHGDRWDLMAAFDYRFVSFEVGHVKPDRAIFEHATRVLDTAPERVLFLDDNTINVDGARAAGLRAERTVGVDAARRCLVDNGLLPGP